MWCGGAVTKLLGGSKDGAEEDMRERCETENAHALSQTLSLGEMYTFAF